MEELLKLNQVNLYIEGDVLIKTDHVGVRSDDVIGLIGKNGAGKTTLLNMITGSFTDFTGTLECHIPLDEITYVEQEVRSLTEASEQPYHRSKLSRRWQKQSGFEQLSGGEKLKKRILAGFSKNSSLLILDEPTNHLDEVSVANLIAAIKGYSGGVIIVSHDRYFLDQVATSIWSIEDQQLQSFPGNYSDFSALREASREAQRREFIAQEKEVKRVKKEIQQLSTWSTSAHAQSTKKNPRQIGSKEYFRMKAKKMDKQRKSIQTRLENDLTKHTVQRVRDDYQVRFDLDTSKQKSGPLYLAENLSKVYPDKVIVKDSDFSIMFGERLAITGDNGAGKTTLLKILLGEETFQGKLWQSDAAEVGYLSQEVYDLPSEQTIAAYFDLSRDEQRRGMTLFVHLGFASSQWEQRISELSMGERVKIKLMSHILQEKNVLILDEPTNHLDIPTREELERVLATYNGTLIFVSHDRYFREKVSQRQLALKGEKIIDLSGKVSDELPSDKLLLEFQRDQLLAQLSLISNTEPTYVELNKKFEEVQKKLSQLV